MYEDLSSKQLQILIFLKEETVNKGYPPSVREICEAVDLKSTSTVHGHLFKLQEKGYIRRDPTKPRAIEILCNNLYEEFPNKNKEIAYIPIVGKVTAGTPILAVENIEETFPLPISFLPSGNDPVFMLLVKGDSMINAGILSGDYVIVRQQHNASNGDTVVALLDDKATVKTFYKEFDKIRLQPQNKYMDPIIANDVKILGKVVGVFRKM